MSHGCNNQINKKNNFIKKYLNGIGMCYQVPFYDSFSLKKMKFSLKIAIENFLFFLFKSGEYVLKPDEMVRTPYVSRLIMRKFKVKFT